jgi:hypothetical protein
MLPVCSSLVVLLVACLYSSSARAVSVGYYNSRANTKDVIVNSGLRLTESPNAEHVADLYARLCGLPPILNEGKCSFLFFFFLF